MGMGAILAIGDTVMGLDLRNSNDNNPDLELMSADKIPDVILVKKVYADKTFRNRRRRWRLKRMEGLPHLDTESCNNDDDDAGMPQISLAEMLDDLEIGEDATGGEGAVM